MTIVVDNDARATTAMDVITTALKLVGEVGAGETVSSDDANDCLTSLNDMLDSWWNDRLSVHQIKKEYFTLTSLDGEYTIGENGDFNTTRPVKIIDAFTRTSEGIDYPLTILEDVKAYNRLSSKSVTSDISYYMHYEDAYPLGKIFLYPIPTQANTLYLFSWKQLRAFNSLTDQVLLPPGYDRAIKYNLAREINPLFGGAMTQDAREIAIEALSKIKSVNRKPIIARVDIMSDRARYDIYSDTYR